MWSIFFQGQYVRCLSSVCADVLLSLVLCISLDLVKNTWEEKTSFTDEEWIMCKLFVENYEIIVYLKLLYFVSVRKLWTLSIKRLSLEVCITMQDCILLQCKSKLLLSALLLLVVCAFLCEDCVCVYQYLICSFHISLFVFHFIPCFSFQNISHFSSYDCVEMRNGTKDNSVSYVDKRQVRCLCVFIVAFCIGL